MVPTFVRRSLSGLAIISGILAGSACIKLDVSPLDNPLILPQALAPRLIAVGQGGMGYGSIDGLNWLSAVVANGVDFYGVIHTGRRWIIAGGIPAGAARIYVSDDGRSWSAATVPTVNGRLLDLAMRSADQVVAVGQTLAGAPLAMVSNDGGLTWSSLGTSGTFPYARVVFTGSVFLVTDDPNNAAQVFSYTSNGTAAFAATANRPISGAKQNRLGSMVAVGSRIVVSVTDPCCLGTGAALSVESTDNGANWSASTNIFGGNTLDELPLGIAADAANATLVAVGQACRVDRTTNIPALTWNSTGQFMGGCSGINWRGLTYDAGKFIAVGSTGTQARVAISATGSTNDWTIANLPGADVQKVAARR